jgi:hypothetical protein
MQEQDSKREEGRLEGEVVKDKMPIVIILVGNLRLRGRDIRDLVFSLDLREKEHVYVGVLCS